MFKVEDNEMSQEHLIVGRQTKEGQGLGWL